MAGPRTRPRRSRGERSSGATHSSPPSRCARPSAGSERPSERRSGARWTASQESAKRSARRPSGVAWVASVATATGITTSRSGQSSSPSAQAADPRRRQRAERGDRPADPTPGARAREPGDRGDRQSHRRRARAEGDDGEKRSSRVGEPAQRHPARHRQRPALDRVDAALGAENPLVGADRLVAVAHGRIRLPIARAASATWSGEKTSQPTRIAASRKTARSVNFLLRRKTSPTIASRPP